MVGTHFPQLSLDSLSLKLESLIPTTSTGNSTVQVKIVMEAKSIMSKRRKRRNM